MKIDRSSSERALVSGARSPSSAASSRSLGLAACGGSGSSRPTLPSVSRSTTTRPESSSTSSPAVSTSPPSVTTEPPTPTVTAGVSTTSRVPVTTTTTEPPTTTTTEPPTTTTTEPPTTTTTEPPTTTTAPPPTTTTTADEGRLRTILLLPQQEDTATTSETSETSDAWIWVLLVVLLVLLGVAIAMLVRRRRAAARARQLWHDEGGRILEHATTTAALLAEATASPAAMSQASEAVRRAGEELDRLAADAPSDEAGAAAAAVAARMRSVLFDVESDALLRGPAPGTTAAGARPPADAELTTRLAQLRGHVERAIAPPS